MTDDACPCTLAACCAWAGGPGPGQPLRQHRDAHGHPGRGGSAGIPGVGVRGAAAWPGRKLRDRQRCLVTWLASPFRFRVVGLALLATTSQGKITVGVAYSAFIYAFSLAFAVSNVSSISGEPAHQLRMQLDGASGMQGLAPGVLLAIGHPAAAERCRLCGVCCHCRRGVQGHGGGRPPGRLPAHSGPGAADLTRWGSWAAERAGLTVQGCCAVGIRAAGRALQAPHVGVLLCLSLQVPSSLPAWLGMWS